MKLSSDLHEGSLTYMPLPTHLHTIIKIFFKVLLKKIKTSLNGVVHIRSADLNPIRMRQQVQGRDVRKLRIKSGQSNCELTWNAAV